MSTRSELAKSSEFTPDHVDHEQKLRDERADRCYRKMWLWVEHLSNSEVSFDSIEGILKRHARKVDGYGGALP